MQDSEKRTKILTSSANKFMGPSPTFQNLKDKKSTKPNLLILFAGLYIITFCFFSLIINDYFWWIETSKLYKNLIPSFLQINSKFDYNSIRRFSWPPTLSPKDYEKYNNLSLDFPKTSFPLKIVWWTKWFAMDRFSESFTSETCEFPIELPEKPQQSLLFLKINLFSSKISIISQFWTQISKKIDEIWCTNTHDRRESKNAVFLGFHVRDTNVNKKVYPSPLSANFVGNYFGVPARQFLNPAQKWFLMTQVSFIIHVFFEDPIDLT